MLDGSVQPPDDTLPSASDMLDTAEVLESVPASGKPGQSYLSEKQRLWAAYFILTNGNATDAARRAGYGSPATSGLKNMVNARIMQEVRRIAAANINSHIPLAFASLVRVMENPEADARAVVAAANSILDRAGLRPKSGAPGIQVNVQINGQQAQAAIAEVWEARQSRLERREHNLSVLDRRYDDGLIRHTGNMSDIDDTMSDVSHDVDAARAVVDAADAGQGGGGCAPQGPAVPPSSIPPHQSEHLPENAGDLD